MFVAEMLGFKNPWWEVYGRPLNMQATSITNLVLKRLNVIKKYQIFMSHRKGPEGSYIAYFWARNNWEAVKKADMLREKANGVKSKTYRINYLKRVDPLDEKKVLEILDTGRLGDLYGY